MKTTAPLYILHKPKSRRRIEIHVDYDMDPDGWFLRINYVENKSNAVSLGPCIIEKDLNSWMDSLAKDGWIVES